MDATIIPFAFRRQNAHHLIPIHPDNAGKKDWIIVLEANTIIDPSTHRLRVARATQERKVVKKFSAWKLQLFLLVEGYDPRIHVVFLCPQLYRYDHDSRLVPMEGEEIGKFIAQALESKTKVRRPWYEPIESILAGSLISETMLNEFDTVVIEPVASRPELAAPFERRLSDKQFESVPIAPN